MYRWSHFIVPLTRKMREIVNLWKTAWLYNVQNIQQKDIKNNLSTKAVAGFKQHRDFRYTKHIRYMLRFKIITAGKL